MFGISYFLKNTYVALERKKDMDMDKIHYYDYYDDYEEFPCTSAGNMKYFDRDKPQFITVTQLYVMIKSS